MIMLIWKLGGAFFATATLSVVFQIPRKYIALAAVTGTLGWGVYLLMLNVDNGYFLANFIATVVVTIVSHIMARIIQAPVTMFLIPGVIPLVPGAGMYKIIAALLSSTPNQASEYFIETMQMAGAIALGIFIVDTFSRSFVLLSKEQK